MKKGPGEHQAPPPLDPGDLSAGHFESVFEHYLPPGAIYRISRRGYEFVTIDPTVPYPDSRALSGPVRELLLDEESLPSDLRTFRLPPNTILMGMALNEAAGTQAQTGRILRHQRDKPLDLLFRTFGAMFSQIGDALNQGYTFSGLDYRQVLVQKDVLKVRLLPPLEVTTLPAEASVASEEQRLADGFVESLQRGIKTPSDYALYSRLKSRLDEVIRQSLEKARK
ncbi:hypothetical protein HYW35_02405 [Candidatus Saccharibacteria bacterium]|nr:hypothetical protein [Candidatus Saccharibacteria bacterium]